MEANVKIIFSISIVFIIVILAGIFILLLKIDNNNDERYKAMGGKSYEIKLKRLFIRKKCPRRSDGFILRKTGVHEILKTYELRTTIFSNKHTCFPILTKTEWDE